MQMAASAWLDLFARLMGCCKDPKMPFSDTRHKNTCVKLNRDRPPIEGSMEGFQTIIIFSERKTKLVHYYFGLLLGLPALLVHNGDEMLSQVVVLFCWPKLFHEIFHGA